MIPHSRTAAAILALGAPALGAQSPFNLGRLAAGEQAFELRTNGRPVGTLTGTLSRTGDAWTYVEKTVIPGRTEQTTEARISSAGAMISVKQTGTTPVGATSIDVTYGGGRAKGSATTPAAGALKTIAIDTTVPRFAIDDNLLQPLLPALPFSAGASATVQIFSSGQGTSTDMTLNVVGSEQVTVPFGTADAWKVEARGPTTVVFFVAKAAPHTVLKMSVEGSPLEMVRVR